PADRLLGVDEGHAPQDGVGDEGGDQRVEVGFDHHQAVDEPDHRRHRQHHRQHPDHPAGVVVDQTGGEQGGEAGGGADRQVDGADEDGGHLAQGGEAGGQQLSGQVGEVAAGEEERGHEGGLYREQRHQRPHEDPPVGSPAEGGAQAAHRVTSIVATAMISSGENGFWSKVAASLPSRMTSTRSDKPRTSGSSDEMRMMARPSSASRRSMRWISDLALTSMPRSGSSRIRSFGCFTSHLPRAIFCWFPPDSEDTGAVTSEMRTARSETTPDASSRSRDRSTKPSLESAPREGRPTFRSAPRSRITPDRFRSSGTSMTPERAAWRGLRGW